MCHHVKKQYQAVKAKKAKEVFKCKTWKKTFVLKYKLKRHTHNFERYECVFYKKKYVQYPHKKCVPVPEDEEEPMINNFIH